MEAEDDNDGIEMEYEDSDDQSQNSTSTEPSSGDEEVDISKLYSLEKQIQENPYLYDHHVHLISLTRKLGDLEKVRKAREDMSEIFPLTPELWLDWLTDEEKLVSTIDDKKNVIALCERAVKDYTSVSLWLEYAQFMIGLMGDEFGVESVRSTFEKALVAVGLHVTEGSLLYDAYREFENAMLSTLQCATEDSEECREAKLKEQKNRIYNLYKRQLSVPLLHMEKTYEEFKEAFPGPIDSAIEWQYQEARKKLEQVMPFENALFQSEVPHLEEYKSYIKFEKKNGNPSRVRILYERALLENCLLPELWIEYTKYLDCTIKEENVVQQTYERAVRNCPWSVDCWKNYAMVMERCGQPHDAIKGMYEKALSSGFSKGEEYREIWMGYLDYLRRRIKWDQSHDAELKDLNVVFDRATEHMTYFQESNAEYALWAQCSILQYQAKIEAKYCKNMVAARETWNKIMNLGYQGEAQMWHNFANFEKLYGDEEHYREVLFKALRSVSDYPDVIGNLLITFEREEGTLETLTTAIKKYEIQMQRNDEKMQKKAEKEAKRQQLEAEKEAEKQQLKVEQKARAKAKGKPAFNQQLQSWKSQEANKADIKMDSEGFKIPCVPSKTVRVSPDKKENVHEPRETVKRAADEVPEFENKKPKVDGGEPEHGMTMPHDPLKDERTVFLSNLAYTTEEKDIREMFSEIGNIEEVRLVRDYKGRSKGYCYVVYSNRTEAENALKKDRSKLNGRPVFVSPCQDKKSGVASQQKFKFGTGLEKNKLFVRGLPFSMTEDELKELFKQYGALKEVRLVTYRNGHSKGLAYVEFENETDAAAALVKTDGSQINEHTISVAISNPPERKPKKDQFGTSLSVSSLLGGGGGSAVAGPRGKGRTQISLLPRALQRPSATQPRAVNSSQKTVQRVQNGASSASSSSTESAKDDGKLSNADFRNLLMKKS